MRPSGADSQTMQRVAGQLAVCFASGRVDAATAAALQDLFPGAQLLSMSILAGGQLLITADNVAKEGFFKISFLRLNETVAGEAVRKNIMTSAHRSNGSSSTYYDMEHAYDAGSVTTLCCAPIPHSAAVLGPADPSPAAAGRLAAMGALTLGFTAQTHISQSHLGHLGELAALISPFLMRYAYTMIKDLTSVFFQPTLARCLCGCTCGRCEDGEETCRAEDDDLDQEGCADYMEFLSEDDMEDLGVVLPEGPTLDGRPGGADQAYTAKAASDSPVRVGSFPRSSLSTIHEPESGPVTAESLRQGLEAHRRRQEGADQDGLSVESVVGSDDDAAPDDGVYEAADELLAQQAQQAQRARPSTVSAGTARLTDAQLRVQQGQQAGQPSTQRSSLEVCYDSPRNSVDRSVDSRCSNISSQAYTAPSKATSKDSLKGVSTRQGTLLTFEDDNLEAGFRNWQAAHQIKVDAIFGLLFTGVWLLLSFLAPYHVAHRTSRGQWALGTLALMLPLAVMAASLRVYVQHREKLLVALNIFFAVFLRCCVLPLLVELAPRERLASLPWLIKLSGAEELICHSLGGMVRFAVYLPMQLVCVSVVASAMPSTCDAADLPRSCLPLMWAMVLGVGYALPAAVIYCQECRARRIFLNSLSGAQHA